MTTTHDIAVGNLDWRAHHEWTEGKTKQVDGYIDGETKSQLDIVCTSDLTVCAHEDACAELAWMSGRVYCAQPDDGWGVPTLIVPGSYLTREQMTEALRRFNP